MSETNQQSTGPLSPLDVARLYASDDPVFRSMDGWFGTRPPSDEQRQAAEDTVHYLESRPARPEDLPDPDAHYQQTLGQVASDEGRDATDLVDEWAAADTQGDRTRATEIEDELAQRSEKLSRLPGESPGERPANAMDALHSRKERVEQQFVLPQEQPKYNAWQQTKVTIGNFLYNPERPHRRTWLYAGALAVAWIGGAVTTYLAFRHGWFPHHHIYGGGKGTVPPTHPPEPAPSAPAEPQPQPTPSAPAEPPQPTPPAPVQPPPEPVPPAHPIESPRVDQSLADDHSTVWAAEQGLYPDQADTQTSQALLGDFATLKAHGWQGDYWVDPQDPNVWGFSDTFTAPKDQHLLFPDGHIEHLDGQTYSGTNGTFGALEYADAYNHAQVITADQANQLVGAHVMTPDSFTPFDQQQATVTAAPAAFTRMPDVRLGAAAAAPMVSALAWLAHSRVWQEEFRHRLDEEEE